MSPRPLIVIALLFAGSAAISACTPINSTNGFIAVDTQAQEIKVGESRTAVATKLGTPSTVGAFDKSTWYYITQTSDKMAYLNPRVKSRTVVAISFDKDEKVAEVKTLALKDGFDLAYEKRETPTRGRELSWIEQLLGNVGRGGMLPQENDPGQRPGSGSGRGGRP